MRKNWRAAGDEGGTGGLEGGKDLALSGFWGGAEGGAGDGREEETS